MVDGGLMSLAIENHSLNEDVMKWADVHKLRGVTCVLSMLGWEI